MCRFQSVTVRRCVAVYFLSETGIREEMKAYGTFTEKSKAAK